MDLSLLDSALLGKIILVMGGLSVIFIFIKILQHSVSKSFQNHDLRYRARKIIAYFSYLLIIALIMVIFNKELGGLSVTFGLAGAGIAVALQEVIVSVAGWVAIIFGNFYSIGDRIQLKGIKGDVIDIGILRTTLMEIGEWVDGDLYNGRIVLVANSYVFKEPVFNFSGDFPFLWDEIKVPIKYGSDYKLAKEIVLRIADEIVGDYALSVKDSWQDMVRKYMIEDARVEPVVHLKANDNWIEITVRYVVDYKMRRGTKDQIFTRILEEIEKTQGAVSIGSATIHLVETPTLNVKINGGS